jgi:predicted ATPase
MQQVVATTDGVPLFVEELTKMVVELGFVKEQEGRYELTGPLPSLAIPSTLHDSLMARLDRLGPAKQIAQLGAVVGREFAYEVLQAVSPMEETTLQHGLAQLVEAELLYQRGLPPQARYMFKHALIQEAAYQSLLRSPRRQHHQRIARVLEERFSDTCKTHPELLAYHYTEAGLREEALPYWQKAGQRAIERSANAEAIAHLSAALALLQTFPDTADRRRQEFLVQTMMGAALLASRGYAAPEVETAYTRAYELGQHVGDTPQLLPMLWGLWFFAMGRAEFGRAQMLGEHLLQMGQRVQDPILLLAGHTATGTTLLLLGEFAQACLHLEQYMSLYDPQQHRTLAFLYGMDYGIMGRALLGWPRLVQGYPSQSLQLSEEALRLAQEVAHPYTLASILHYTTLAHLWRRDIQRTREQGEALIALATEQGFTLRVAHGAFVHGWALTMQGEADSGLAQIREALAAWRATGAALGQSYLLGLFAEACWQAGQVEAGLHALEEALAHVDRTGERLWEAELHRLKGELLCRHTAGQEAEAETCFQQALAVAHGQGARWFELRTAVSLARLWQRQGKNAEARQRLAAIYDWFTEGFETPDLQEAQTLLATL